MLYVREDDALPSGPDGLCVSGELQAEGVRGLLIIITIQTGCMEVCVWKGVLGERGVCFPLSSSKDS